MTSAPAALPELREARGWLTDALDDGAVVRADRDASTRFTTKGRLELVESLLDLGGIGTSLVDDETVLAELLKEFMHAELELLGLLNLAVKDQLQEEERINDRDMLGRALPNFPWFIVAGVTHGYVCYPVGITRP